MTAHVWVVEIRNRQGEWVACMMSNHNTKKSAKYDQRQMQEFALQENLRIRKYVRVEEAP